MLIKTKIVSSQIADSKPVKQEVNGIVILPHLVFPAQSILFVRSVSDGAKEIRINGHLPKTS